MSSSASMWFSPEMGVIFKSETVAMPISRKVDASSTMSSLCGKYFLRNS
jgi:hypothetical protein